MRGCWKTKWDPKLAGSIDLNDVLNKIGCWGKFQWIQLGLLFIIGLQGGVGVVSFVFTGFLPKYRCLVPQCESLENATYYKNPVSYLNESFDQRDFEFEDFVLAALGDVNGQKRHACERVTFEDDTDTCRTFVAKLNDNNMSVVSKRRAIKCSTDNLVFDKSYVESSFAIDYGFVCSNFHLRGIFNSLVMVGMLIGSVSVGIVSDHAGRKRTMHLVNLILVVAGVTNAFEPPIFIFAICRILIGMCAIGQGIAAYICLIEGTSSRFVN